MQIGRLRSPCGFSCTHSTTPRHCLALYGRSPTPRLGRFDIRASSSTKDKTDLAEFLTSCTSDEIGAQQILNWLHNKRDGTVFSLSSSRGLKLIDVLIKLKETRDLHKLYDDSKPGEKPKHILASLVQKMYTTALRKERTKFAINFDKEAAQVMHCTQHWHMTRTPTHCA